MEITEKFRTRVYKTTEQLDQREIRLGSYFQSKSFKEDCWEAIEFDLHICNASKTSLDLKVTLAMTDIESIKQVFADLKKEYPVLNHFRLEKDKIIFDTQEPKPTLNNVFKLSH